MNTSHTVLAAAFALLAASLATAGTQQERPLESLVAESQTIVVGEAISARSEWHDGSLVTRYTIQVSETLKGAHAPSIVVTVPGGIDLKRKIPIAMTVSGAPSLMPHEPVLLMLRADDSIVGFNRGLFQGRLASDGVRQKIRAMERRP